MTSRSEIAPHAAPLIVEEDNGLAAYLGSGATTRARAAALREPAVLQAARDTLEAAFRGDDQRRQYLDPFAPAQARNAEVVAVLRQVIAEHRVHGGPLARVPTDDVTLIALFAATVGWGPAQRYLDDPQVNEIKIVGTRIRVQEAGKPFVTVPETFDAAEDVEARAVLLASLLNVRLDADIPQATLPIAHGTRMHVSIPPRTVDGALICIRRGRGAAWTVADLCARGTLSAEVAALLALFSRARCAVLIAGRTGSGKTGLLEALANSWPGDPHVITIEDHTLEIGIAHSTWTRELVDTQRDPLAFGRVAREALRQTPDLLIPGEVRANEAGAILSLVLSDHPVLTTLHARSCAEAVARFASCAALPGAYTYEGRRDDALRDACSGFRVLITVDFWEDIGRRLITEIALLDGATMQRGVVTPILIPLVRVAVQDDGTVGWSSAAHVGDDGMLAWADAHDHTPATLREQLLRARALVQVRATATTLDVVAEVLARAERLLLASAPERALAALTSAWQQRRDPRLLALAQRALSQVPDRFAASTAQAQVQARAIAAHLAAQRWDAAQRVYNQISADLGTAAAATPVGGWEAVASQIAAGLALEAHIIDSCGLAETALRQSQPQAAIDTLRRFTLSELPARWSLPLIRLREQAMAMLLAQGEGSAEVLRSLRAQRAALEQAHAQKEPTDGEALV